MIPLHLISSPFTLLYCTAFCSVYHPFVLARNTKATRIHAKRETRTLVTRIKNSTRHTKPELLAFSPETSRGSSLETFHFTSRLASVEQYGMKLYGLCAAGLWMYCFVGHAGRGMVVLCFNQSFGLAVRRVRLFLRYDTPCYRCCCCRSTSNDQ